MKRKEFITLTVAAAAALPVGVSVAQMTQRDAAQTRSRDQWPEVERIYGSDPMTHQQRNPDRGLWMAMIFRSGPVFPGAAAFAEQSFRFLTMEISR